MCSRSHQSEVSLVPHTAQSQSKVERFHEMQECINKLSPTPRGGGEFYLCEGAGEVYLCALVKYK